MKPLTFIFSRKRFLPLLFFRLVFLCGCVFVSNQSFTAPTWIKYYRTQAAEFFYNPASIKQSIKPGEVNVFVMSNYTFTTKMGEKSVLVRQILDCKRGRYKILVFKSFSELNAKGRMLVSNGVSKGWTYVVSRTPDSILLRIACTG